MRDASTICINCMSDKGTHVRCPRCAYDETQHIPHPLYLRPRTRLKKQYIVGKVLGQGGFGVTYLGLDTWLNKPVAIKEYLPSTLATRDLQGNQVIPLVNQEAAFARGLGLFLDEARHLARFRHPHIVRVFNYFEAHRTGYMVMEYLEGPSPSLRARGGRLPQEEALALVLPILDALEQVHAQQVYHLDICLHNLRLDAAGQPVLIDFGAARQVIGDYTHSLALVLRPGYSPLEQYADKGRIGPWTDIYACGALLYVLLAGRLPPSAPERLEQDRIQWPGELGISLHPALDRALRQSLAVRAEGRFQNVAELRRALSDCGIVPRLPRPATPLRPRRLGLALLALFLIALAVGGWVIKQDALPPRPPPPVDTPSAPLAALALPDAPSLAALPLAPEPLPIIAENSEQAEIARLLARAEAQGKERKLTTPPGDNAYESLRAILSLAPEHPAALVGLRRIADEYWKLAREAENNQSEQAEWIRKGLAVWPRHEGLLALQAKLAAAQRAPALLPDQAPPLQAEALAALEKGEWEQAYRLYQQVLSAQPGDPTARQGLEKIAGHYRQAAENDYRAGRLAESLVWVAKGLAVAPKHPALSALQAEISARLEKQAAPPEPPPVAAPSPPSRPVPDNKPDPVLVTPSF